MGSEHKTHSGFLVPAAFSSATIKKYMGATLKFIDFAKDCGYTLRTAEEADRALVHFFEDYYLTRDGRGRGTCEAALYGLSLLRPAWAKELYLAKLALKGWGSLVQVQSFAPFPRDVMVVVAVQMARTYGLGAGVAVLVAFDCLLRVSELCALRVRDVRRYRDQVILHIDTSKTGRHQLVTMRHSRIVAVFGMYLKQRSDSGRCFDFSAWQFRKWLGCVCEQLGLTERYVPHSLRHGGATEMLLDGVDIERILHQGRWVSTNSARRYLQMGKALVIYMDTPKKVKQLGDLFWECLVDTFSLLR